MTPEQLAEQREREAVIAERQSQINEERLAERAALRERRNQIRQEALYARRRNG
jgi:hypothetical protein